MQKILLLGGLRYLIPVIKKAHELGLYAITCDNVPHNIAHKYSDEFYNVSILDKEAVLELARKLKISGILSFAVDPGVLTAAYVAEKLQLPSVGSYEAVKILQTKDLFRKFLRDNHFKTPFFKGYSAYEEVVKDLERFNFPVIVKPVDSAGSKGVSRVNGIEGLKDAFRNAYKNSFTDRVIVEEFIEQKGYASDSDSFSVNGKLAFCSFSDQIFEKDAVNPYTPAGFIWDSSMEYQYREELKQEIQRLISLLNLKSSVYNIETRVSKLGIPYIMEMSPRGGGNRISEMLLKSTGIDLIKNSILAAIGKTPELPSQHTTDGVWSELILYSDIEGVFKNIHISPLLTPYLIEKDLWINAGDKVKPFTGANETIGTLIFRFPDRERLNALWKDIRKLVNIEVE